MPLRVPLSRISRADPRTKGGELMRPSRLGIDKSAVLSLTARYTLTGREEDVSGKGCTLKFFRGRDRRGCLQVMLWKEPLCGMTSTITPRYTARNWRTGIS